ncbi:MAG: hypothetical protein WD334_07305, partial [Chitinophagales bacterium]
MKTLELNLKKVALLVATILLTSTSAIGATFTAVASGNFSSSATWGGSAPPANVSTDQIIIPVGITVDLDNDLTLNGATASLDVNGTLNTSSNASFYASTGTISGTGNIMVDSVATGAGAVFLFTGSLSANAMANAAASLQMGADLDVGQTLTLAPASTLSLITGGSLTIGNNATIVVDSGGGLSISGGGIGFSGNYNVVYTGGAAISGVELSGSSITDVNVDVGAVNSVTLTSDLTVNGDLML